MSISKLTLAAAALVATAGLSACVDDGYGAGGVSVGYASAWDPYYGGYRGDPYWGWQGDYYYPGTGYYVYDRQNVRRRWDDRQRGYWQGRNRTWRNDRREIRPMWRDYGVQGRPGAGAGAGAGLGGASRPSSLTGGPGPDQADRDEGHHRHVVLVDDRHPVAEAAHVRAAL